MKLAPLIVLLWATVASAAGLNDFVDLGAGQTIISSDIVGGHDMRRPALVVGEKGEHKFELHVTPDEPLSIEIEEFDGRGAGVRAYHVLVDDKPVYFRTWRESGAGPVHCFVQLPPPGRERVSVRLVNRSPVAFAVGRVWAWGGLEKHFDEGEFDVPFRLAPTVRWRDARQQLETIKRSFGEHAHVKPAWTVHVPYAASSEEQTHRRIDETLKLAEEFDLPVQVSFDSWWGSTPRGPDGKGGRWTDEAYQQVVWNESAKRMELSTPNRWANTPWLTVNHPDLNAFKVARLRATAAYLAKAAAGKRHLILAVNLDNEPIYWASGNAALGDQLKWADFNDRAVAAAKADGVTIDPRDGLSREERLWLWKNLLNYNGMIASASVEGLRGEEASDDPLADNVYTQAMMMADPARQFPTMDAAYPLWESAALAQARVGGEWNGDTRTLRRQIEHQIPLGRTAATNAECDDDAGEHRGVRLAYALGQRFYTAYNYPLDQLHVAAADVDDVSTPLPAALDEPTLAEYRFDDADWTKRVASHDGVTTKLIGNTAALALVPESNEKFGQVTFRVNTGSAVELRCRANDYSAPDDAVKIRVLAGGSPDVATMRELKVISRSRDLDIDHRVELSNVEFVRIELHAPTVGPANLSWCALHRVRFTTPWPRELSAELPRQDESLRVMRKQSLLVSWRRDAELAIARLPAEQRTVASEAYDKGRYGDAYRIAAKAWKR